MSPIAILVISLIVSVVNIEAAGPTFQLSTPCGGEGICGENGTCQTNSLTCTCRDDDTVYDKKCVSRLFEISLRNNNLEAYDDAGNCKLSAKRDICSEYWAVCAGTKDKPKCKCPEGYVHSLRPGEIEHCFPASYTCVNETSCFDPNGECRRGTCMCRSGYYVAPHGKMCVTNRFDTGGCVPNAFCGSLLGKCQSDKKTCKCSSLLDHFAHDGICTTDRFDKLCFTRSPCASGNGVCNMYKGKCFCKLGYFAEGIMCVRRWFKPESGCPANTKCGGDDGVCDTTGTCVCKNGSFHKHNQCVKRYFNTPACILRNDQPCGDGYGKCSMDRCLCSSEINDYEFQEAWALNGTCVFTTFDEMACLTEGLLCSRGNGQCTKDKKCRCNEPLFVMPPTPLCYVSAEQIAKQSQTDSGTTAVLGLLVCLLSTTATIFLRV